MAQKTIEDGIRSYLDGLGQSDKPVVDREAVKNLKAQIRDETDSLNKLKLLVALQDEEAGHLPDRSGDQAVFVAEAKAWADGEGIPASAFQALGVPDEVLAQAGFTITVAPARSAPRASSGSRAPRIPFADVQAAALKLGAEWKLSDLASLLDRDVATARNYLAKLIQEGDVTIIGDDPHHDGRGRAPKLYRSN